MDILDIFWTFYLNHLSPYGAIFKGFVHIMAYFHQRIRIRIRIPNPIVTLYYAQLFPLVGIWIQIPVWIVSRVVTVPILGTDLHPQGQIFIPIPYIWIRGSESESEPVEKSA